MIIVNVIYFLDLFYKVIWCDVKNMMKIIDVV